MFSPLSITLIKALFSYGLINLINLFYYITKTRWFQHRYFNITILICSITIDVRPKA